MIIVRCLHYYSTRNVELPFAWALLEPVLYARDDFSNQSQPKEIERHICEKAAFHVEPNYGTFPPLAQVEFRLIFAPSTVIERNCLID
jgi:hypothetical protein